MVKNFKRGFNGDYGVKLTPNKLKALCEVDWPAVGVGWSLEGSLDKTVVNEVCRVILGKTGTQNNFPILTVAGCSSQLTHMKAPSGRGLQNYVR
jgi:hypothetical protein